MKVDLQNLPGLYLLSLETCVSCGNCLVECPTYKASNERIHIPGARMKGIMQAYRKARLAPEFVNESFGRMIWECTLCGYCQEACPFDIRTNPIYLAVRSALYKACLVPEQTLKLAKILKESHNILGKPNDKRIAWFEFRSRKNSRLIKKLGVDSAPNYCELRIEDIVREKAETIYFVGCNSSFFMGLSGIPDAMVRILHHAGIEFTLLAEDEWCCGYPLLLSGDLEGFREAAKHNIEVIRRRGAKRVVFTCAGCYKVFKYYYARIADLNLDFDVLHSTQLISQLYREGKLKKINGATKVTYHDPCDIGRHGNIYEEPRAVIKMSGYSLVEMDKHCEESACCGGGGLLKSTSPELSSEIASERVAQAIKTKAEILSSGCPSCIITLKEAVQSSNSKLKVLDIVEIVALSHGLIPRQ